MPADRLLTLLTGICLLMNTSAQAQTTKVVEKNVSIGSGKQEPIGIFGRVTPQCTNGQVSVRVTQAALNGTLTPQRAKTKVGAVTKCPELSAETAVFFYRSNPNFTGKDRVVIEVETDTGRTERHVYTIVVR